MEGACFQKNWLEDSACSALNVNYELEFEKTDSGDYEREGMFEWFTGLSYRFVRNWSGGLEFWNHHEFADATVHEHSATLSVQQFTMAANAGGRPSGFSGNCQSASLSAGTTRNSPRTTATFLAMSTRNITCACGSVSIFDRAIRRQKIATLRQRTCSGGVRQLKR